MTTEVGVITRTIERNISELKEKGKLTKIKSSGMDCIKIKIMLNYVDISNIRTD